MKFINIKKLSNLLKTVINNIYVFFSKNLFKILIMLFLCIASIVIIYTYFHTAKYSYVLEDDFIHLMQYTEIPNNIDSHNILLEGIKYAKHQYKIWNGNYFSNFLIILLGIYGKTDILLFNQFALVFNVVLFFISIYFFIYALISALVLKEKKIIDKILVSLYLFCLINISCFAFLLYTDIFSWISGATSYSFPLSLFLISFGILILSNGIKNLVIKIVLFIFSSLIGILSVGGSLEITAFAGTFVFSYMIYCFVKKEKISIFSLLTIVIYLIFAIVNIKAPGNFARIDKMASYFNNEAKAFSSGLNGIIKYLFDAITLRLDVIRDNYLQINFIMIASLLFGYIIYFLKSEKLSRGYYISFFTFIFSPIIIFTPVAICYTNSETFFMPDRVCMALDISIILIYTNLFFIIGYNVTYVIDIISKKIGISKYFFECLPIVLILFLTFNVVYNKKSISSFEECSAINIYNNIFENKYKVGFEKYSKLLNELEKQKDVDVAYISNENVPDELTGIKPFLLENNLGLNFYYNIGGIRIK